jgi:hypothetical protein
MRDEERKMKDEGRKMKDEGRKMKDEGRRTKDEGRRTKEENNRECKRVRGLSTCIRYGNGNIRDIQKFPRGRKIFFNRSDQKIFEICMHEPRGRMAETEVQGSIHQ